MTNIKATREPDRVLITWTSSPLSFQSSKRIASVRVIEGSAPCQCDLRQNTLLNDALTCMLDKDIGFKIAFIRRTSPFSGCVLLQRKC